MVWRNITREALNKTKAEFQKDGPLVQAMAMAQEIVLLALGPDFFKQHCVGKKGPDSSFLRPNSSEENDRYLFQHRVIALGEMIYSLKDCAGFEAFLNPLRTNDLQSVFFELRVANELVRSGYQIRFISCKGTKGLDYDLNAHIDGFDVAIEAKTRRAGETNGIPRILDILNTARSQLPQSGPGIIAISIPEEWLLSQYNLLEIEVRSFLRNTARVNHVLAFAESWADRLSGKACVSMIAQFDGVQPRHHFNKNPLIMVHRKLTIDSDSGAEELSFW
jgi:hypothetical protein